MNLLHVHRDPNWREVGVWRYYVCRCGAVRVRRRPISNLMGPVAPGWGVLMRDDHGAFHFDSGWRTGTGLTYPSPEAFRMPTEGPPGPASVSPLPEQRQWSTGHLATPSTTGPGPLDSPAPVRHREVELDLLMSLDSWLSALKHGRIIAAARNRMTEDDRAELDRLCREVRMLTNGAR